jgi:hypothetical protein
VNQGKRWRLWPLLGRPAELEPQLFWLYLGCCWLVAGINGWLHARSGGAIPLALALLFGFLGVQALWIAVRRGRGGDSG